MTTADPKGYYRILNLPPTATLDEIKRSFRSQSEHFHTDKHVVSTPEHRQLMNERFQQINDAYQVLSDERTRIAYDRLGEEGIPKLSLVPVTLKGEKLASALDAIAQQNEIQKTAKLVGSSGSLDVSLTILPLLRRYVLWRRGIVVHPPITASPPLSPPPPPPPPPTQEQGEQHQSTEGSAPLPPSPPQQQQQQQPRAASNEFTPRTIFLDGRNQIVLVPKPPVQMALAERLNINLVPFHPIPNYIPVLRSLSMYQSFQQPIDPSTTLTFFGQAGGLGSTHPNAGIGAQYYHKLGPVSETAVTVKLGNATSTISSRYSRNLSQFWTLNQKFFLNCEEGELKTGMALDVTRQLGEKTAGQLRWDLSGSDAHNSLRTTITKTSEDTVYAFTTRYGFRQLGISLFRSVGNYDGYGAVKNNDDVDAEGGGGDQDGKGDDGGSKTGKTQKFSKQLALSQTAYLDVLGARLLISHEIMFHANKYNKFGIGISTNLPIFGVRGSSFLEMKFLYRRSQHTINVPVVVWRTNSAKTAFKWVTYPWVLFRLVSKFIAKPVMRVLNARAARTYRRTHKEELLKDRTRALDEQEALKDIIASKRADEECVPGGGLIIINALFGVMETSLPDTEEGAAPLTLDVTAPLQRYVDHSKLIMAKGPKHLLPGFCDPDPCGVDPKMLFIRYWFKGRRHEVEYDEYDAIEIPQESHRVDES